MKMGRSYPDFLIIGVQKGGTTSLYQYLLEHPHIAPAATKEVHFFDLQFDLGEDWYRSQFPSLISRPIPSPTAAPQQPDLPSEIPDSSPSNPITGEASPYYCFHPLVPQRVANFCPETKLIILLRDPVARALSHYYHERRWGFEDLALATAIDQEAARLAGESDRFAAEPFYQSYAYQHYSYLARGRYVEQLQAWRSHFPAQQLLVLSSENLYAQPAKTLARVTEFLGLPAIAWQERDIIGQTFNSGEYSKQNGAESGSDDMTARDRLTEYFDPYNQALATYLRSEFPDDFARDFADQSWLQ